MNHIPGQDDATDEHVVADPFFGTMRTLRRPVVEAWRLKQRPRGGDASSLFLCSSDLHA
jgi:hypothetical protein